MKKAVVRVLMLIAVLIASLSVCIYVVNHSNVHILDTDFAYDFKSKLTDSYVELDDYTVAYNNDRKCYEITDKETGAKRQLFNEMSDSGRMIAGPMTSHGNTLYYGDMEKFCNLTISNNGSFFTQRIGSFWLLCHPSINNPIVTIGLGRLSLRKKR